MDEFMKMDIFFFVATVATMICSILLVLVLFSVLRILRHVETLGQMLVDESKGLGEDFALVRAEVREEGLLSALSHLLWKRPRRAPRGRKD